MPTWFRSDDQRVNPDSYYVFVFFSNNRGDLNEALGEMALHASLVAGSAAGPDEGGDLGLRYGAHVKGRPYRNFQAAELEGTMQARCGRDIQVRIGAIGRWEAFVAHARAHVAEPVRRAADATGQLAADATHAAADVAEGAGGLARSLGEGTKAAGFLAELGGPVTGLLILGGLVFVAYKVATARGFL